MVNSFRSQLNVGLYSLLGGVVAGLACTPTVEDSKVGGAGRIYESIQTRGKAVRFELRSASGSVDQRRSVIFQPSAVGFDAEASRYWLTDKPQQVYSAATYLRLRWGDVDPLERDPESLLPELLAARWKHWRSGAQEAAFIVQFATLPFESMQEDLRGLGVQLDVPLHDQAYIARMPLSVANQLLDLPYVRWVGRYHPGFKLEESLAEAVAQRSEEVEHLSVMVMRAAMQGRVAEFVEELGGEVLLTTVGRRMEIRVSADVAGEVVTLPQVLFMDRPGVREVDLDLARQIGGATELQTIRGYTGQGVRAEVMDGGLLTTHQEFQANAPIIHTGNSASVSHGTPVYGIVFGQGVTAGAQGFLRDAEQPIFSAYSQLGDRMAHTARLVDPAGIYRAVFQTNSWGNSRTTSYTTLSAEMDDILFTHDIAVTQSQSNAGDRMSRPQAWAKNVISIGGVRHYNTLGRTDDQWSGGASIGPASDGRIKPDLWHFYDDTYSSSGSGTTSYRQFGGTSGATPITAGHLGLVFQMWADGVFDGAPGQGRDVFASRPHMTTAKALLVNSAYQYPFSGPTDDKTRVHQGWGMPDVKNLYDLAAANSWSLPVLVDETSAIQQGDTQSYSVTVNGAGVLKATMVYADPAGNPSSSVHRVNDLSLRVTSPTGTVYWGNNGLRDGLWSTSGGSANTADTVENVFIQNPTNGTWTVDVIGSAIVQDGRVETSALDADYALVVSFQNSGANTPPVLATIGPQTVSEGQTLSFTAAGTDADGDPITFTASGLPANASFNASTGIFDFTPDFTQAGSYAVTITASDGAGGSDSEVVDITVVDVPSSYAALPYSTGFESGALDQYWSTRTSAPEGRVQVTSSFAPRGAQHLTMDVSANNNFSTNEAWLQLNLAGETQVQLRFYWKEFTDENNAEDGVFLSDDGGATFTKVYDLVNGPATYSQVSLDLAQLASANGLSLTSTFVVKFQQRDNYTIATDGFAFDDVEVTRASSTVPHASLPYATDFETGALDSFWSLSTSDPVGRVQVTSANGPRGGQHLTMDVSTNGTFSTNEASLRLDLSTESEVVLRLWWKEFSDENHPEDGIFFSDDGGSTFVKVYDLVGGTATYQEIVLDLDQLASANGLSLTSTFVVRLQQRDNYGISTDGFGFDDVSVVPGQTAGVTTIYSTDFDNGLDSNWTTATSETVGRVRTTSDFTPRSGQHLTMDVTTNNNFSTNEAALSVDLSGLSQATLSFWWKEFSDEDHPEDGVFISDDGGVSYAKVYDLVGGTATYQEIVLDLDQLASANALSLNSTFVIKLQHRDNYQISTDGFAFDDLTVTGSN